MRPVLRNTTTRAPGLAAGGGVPTKAEANAARIFAAIDLNANGKLSTNEVQALCTWYVRASLRLPRALAVAMVSRVL